MRIRKDIWMLARRPPGPWAVNPWLGGPAVGPQKPEDVESASLAIPQHWNLSMQLERPATAKGRSEHRRSDTSKIEDGLADAQFTT
jgi:hypothetical protein